MSLFHVRDITQTILSFILSPYYRIMSSEAPVSASKATNEQPKVKRIPSKEEENLIMLSAIARGLTNMTAKCNEALGSTDEHVAFVDASYVKRQTTLIARNYKKFLIKNELVDEEGNEQMVKRKKLDARIKAAPPTTPPSAPIKKSSAETPKKRRVKPTQVLPSPVAPPSSPTDSESD